MIIYLDLDNTLCRTDGLNYEGAEPMPDRIAVANRLYDEGNRIIIWTARGAVTGVTLALWSLTKRQLKAWGVKYHELKLDKPYFDLLVDDRALSSLTEVP